MLKKCTLKPEKNKYRFVLHEHFASHHHCDFRLERYGVLKSWALPKCMPVKRAEKRLAVQTPNHPMSYINFKGITPEGQYGAGKTLIKDNGTYQTIKWSNDEIVVNLCGKIYKGKYILIRLPKLKPTDWVIMKGVDEE